LVQLNLQGPAGTADALFIYTETGASASVEAAFDAVKLNNPSGLNLASVALDGTALAIDGQQLAAGTAIPLTVAAPTAGTYTLQAAQLANLPAALVPYLVDMQTGQQTNLLQQPSYSFALSAQQVATAQTGRFLLRFAAASPLASSQALSLKVALYPNPARTHFTVLVPAIAKATAVQATLLNSLGQQVSHQTRTLEATGGQFEVSVLGLAKGIYTLRLQAGGVTLFKRVVVE
jgi:hypothetical protein